jgi:3-hydroxyacyl-CoA dehydrogenase
MKLLEVVRGDKTSHTAMLATAMQIGKKIGKIGGGVGRVPGLHRQPHAARHVANRPRPC